MEAKLAAVQEWATERLRSGAEPPWTYYRLMQLLDALEGLRDPDADLTRDRSLLSECSSENDLRPEAEIFSLETLRRHRDPPQKPTPT